MSNLYVKLFTNFFTHRKTLRLSAALGNDALWIPPRLWAYAVDNQPDGVFADYSAKEIASLIGYQGNASSMLEALLKVKFLDDQPLRIHGWDEHNAYHKTFSERAKKGAKGRWSKTTPPTPPSEGLDIEKRGGEEQAIFKHATSSAPSIPPAIISMSPTAQAISREKQGQKDEGELKRIVAELNKRGNLSDYAAGSPSHNRIKELRARQTELRKKLQVIA